MSRQSKHQRSRSDEHPAQQRGPVRGYQPYATVRSQGSRIVARRRSHTGLVAAILILLAIIGGGLFFWYTHPVTVTINGTQTQVRLWSPIKTVMREKGISVSAGNYVSVGGNVLEQGGGYPFSATVNGNRLADGDASGYHLKDGDDIELSDGDDRMEDYDSWEEDVQPTLRMDGNVGAINYVSQWGQAGRKEVRRGKDSGETADGRTIAEARDCVIKVTDVHPDNGQKLVALTFDDGPAESYTEAYLGILRQYNAKATFFELGNNVEAYPDLAREVLAAGNEVMSHTMSHKQLTSLEADDLQSEIKDSFSAIQDATGVATTAIRPPYGAFREGTWLKSGGCLSLSVRWDQDSRDWERPGANVIVANATTGVRPGSIILMHDGGGNRDQDVEALPRILKTLEDEGYTVTTVGDLLKSDSSIPQDIASGSATMPSGAAWPSEIDAADLSAEG